MPERYDWNRYWIPRGTRPRLADAFLVDPRTRWGRVTNPEAATMDELAELPCLVLLGEPGMGKSDTLRVASGQG